MKNLKSLLRFKYVLLAVAVLAISSCAANRKCNGVRGHRVPMGML